MRADRLLAILLLLQARGPTTARELAGRLEVSVRTIYRDLEALSAGGVPVYTDVGRNGGVRLLDGYRTDLSGLSTTEAGLVPLLGLADVFAGLGLGQSLARAETKLLMSLPDGQRERAERSRHRLHIDLAGWWQALEDVPHLSAVVDTLFANRRLHMQYRRADDTVVERDLSPFGLVLKSGVWYLIAAPTEQEPRVYRVSRILAATPSSESFAVPAGFDLATFWSARRDDFQATRPHFAVTARLRPDARRALMHTHDRTKPVDEPPSDDSGDWSVVELSFESEQHARSRLMALGAAVEVLAPAELRQAISDAAHETAALYGGD